MDSRLDALVRDAMSSYHVPGVAVGIWHEGREELGGWGVTSVDHPLPVDALREVGDTFDDTLHRRRQFIIAGSFPC